MSILIAEDNVAQRAYLREILERDFPSHQPVLEAGDGEETVAMALKNKPEVCILDIQMPKLNGFEVLELIGTDRAIVFVTAFDEYALRAFEIHAVDYLLKPFAAERFETALQRVKQRLGGKVPVPIELATSARPPAQYLERLVVKDGTRVYVIPVAKLDFAEAQDDYVALSTEGKKHLKQQTISSLETALDPQRFLRIHRSYIVNLERVTKIEPYSKDNYVVVLGSGQQLPVSRSGYARLRAFLDQKAQTGPPR